MPRKPRPTSSTSTRASTSTRTRTNGTRARANGNGNGKTNGKTNGNKATRLRPRLASRSTLVSLSAVERKRELLLEKLQANGEGARVLKTYRQRHAISQVKCAEALSVSASYVAKVEAGTAKPNAEILKAILDSDSKR